MRAGGGGGGGVRCVMCGVTALCEGGGGVHGVISVV